MTISCQDSVAWLRQQADHSIENIVTGLPDLQELNLTLANYLLWFNKVSDLIFLKVKKKGYCIFIQTDRKYLGHLIDKSYLLTHQAYQRGLKLLWHKIVLVRDVGKKDLFRPTYSHLLCYSSSGRPGTSFADVFSVSKKLYNNGTPMGVAEAIADFLAGQGCTEVVDPFAGQGTIGMAMVQKGLKFTGLDIDPNQCREAEKNFQKVSQKS